jgi:hypothetical protein
MLDLLWETKTKCIYKNVNLLYHKLHSYNKFTYLYMRWLILFLIMNHQGMMMNRLKLTLELLSDRNILECTICHVTCNCVYSNMWALCLFLATCIVHARWMSAVWSQPLWPPHNIVFSCLQFVFYNFLLVINLMLSTLLTAIFFSTLGLLQRQQLFQNPVIPTKWIHGYIIMQKKLKLISLWC